MGIKMFKKKLPAAEKKKSTCFTFQIKTANFPLKKLPFFEKILFSVSF